MCALHDDVLDVCGTWKVLMICGWHSKPSTVTPPQVMMGNSRRRMITRWRHMSVLSITTIWRLWKIAPPHGQVMMMMIDPLQVHLTRLMMMPQVLHINILPQAHLVVILMMLFHAQAMIVMLLQALQLHHHIASCHKATPR